jgi:hypothetical protein
MNEQQIDWESRVADVWARLEAGTVAHDALVSTIDTLAAERPANHAAALFERACARDTTGIEDEAEHFYRAALASEHLDPYRRSRASIQLGSTLRILGQLDESERLLVAELDRHMQPGNPRALHDEARAILALTYVAQGRAKEAAALALCTLAPHLSRYRRSVHGNAAEWIATTWS